MKMIRHTIIIFLKRPFNVRSDEIREVRGNVSKAEKIR